MGKLESLITTLNNNNKAAEQRNEELETSFARFKVEAEEERRSRMLQNADLALQDIAAGLFNLDDPLNGGNPNSTADSLMQHVAALSQHMSELFESTKSGDESRVRTAIKKALASVKNVLSDAKGLSLKTEDLEMRKQLLENARNISEAATAGLNKLSKNIDESDDWTKSNFSSNITSMNSASSTFVSAIKNYQKENTKSDIPPGKSAAELESLATAELEAAARIIDEATAALKKAQQRKPVVSVKPGEIDLAAVITDAAGAIATAAGHLVAAATEAQREREKKGMLPTSAGNTYLPDFTWTEGLVSAAKNVAMQVQTLVECANDTVDGKVDEAKLIASSKGVAAATTQLVIASAAKAEKFSKSHEKVGKAAVLVRRATNGLVDAARDAATQRQEAEFVIDPNLSDVGRNRLLMEQRARVIRLQQSLKAEQMRLSSLNQEAYANANQHKKSSSRPVSVPARGLRREAISTQTGLSPHNLKREQERVEKALGKGF
eukprot:TRINITY_DN780_c0_g1_i2.p1 TRINITY_DN780_c0_g1~~TRINITY_DN780_c0_g1_i2.p1  ORF type:complete len:494 (-),score=116.92 TRINITY_DN780_c0_g1_i2:1095-2576(-)